jgi:hypothetical protein
MDKIWFKTKTYGWGWTPVTWQGWLCVALYISFVVWMFKDIDQESHSASDTLINFFLPFVIATVILTAVCYKKGEPPRWRWGKNT